MTERRTGREVRAQHPLVEGMHHRSHVIRIPRLASRRRDELERVLAIFDQDLVKGNGRADAHVLTIAEEEYPAECGFVLRQLREAIAEEEVRRTMEGEDLPGAAGALGLASDRRGGPVRRRRRLTRPAVAGASSGGYARQ